MKVSMSCSLGTGCDKFSFFTKDGGSSPKWDGEPPNFFGDETGKEGGSPWTIVSGFPWNWRGLR
jgi:hypothetical protein